MGDIPDRSTFRHPVLEKALSAYFEIVKGDRGKANEYNKFTNTTCSRPVLAHSPNSKRLLNEACCSVRGSRQNLHRYCS